MPPPKNKRSRGEAVDLSAWTSFRPPALSNNIVLPPPSPPAVATVAPALPGLDDVDVASSGQQPQQQQQQQSALPQQQPPPLGDVPASNNAGASTSGDKQAKQQQTKNAATSKPKQQQQQQRKNVPNVLFHHTTDKETAAHHAASSKKNRRGGGSGVGSPSSPGNNPRAGTDRLLYVLNTYQFVVSPAALVPRVHPNIVRAMCSFDEFPSWSHICAVVLSGLDFEEFQCPCCLSAPVCPRMILCGHVFCASCWRLYVAERSALHVRQGKGELSHAGGLVPCPVCSTMTPSSITKPVLFVPRATAPIEGEVEFTRLQRLRSAPVFYKPASGSAVRGLSPVGTPTMPPAPAPAADAAAPAGTSTPPPEQQQQQQQQHADVMEPLPAPQLQQQQQKQQQSGEKTPEEKRISISGSSRHVFTPLPPLALDRADDATRCCRYVAFDADVLQEWASRQLHALEQEVADAEQMLTAVLAGCDCKDTADKNPAALALKAQLGALSDAMAELAQEISMAASAPPMPSAFIFPPNCPLLKHGPGEVVDLYRGTGGHQLLFLHPLTVRMLHDDSASRGEMPPDVVRCTLSDVEPVTQTADLRKRAAFAHIPLGATYHIAFADVRARMLPGVAASFDQPVEDRYAKIRRFLQREAEQTAMLEKTWAAKEKELSRSMQQRVELFGMRTDSTSTSVMDAAEIAHRNSTAFAVALDEKDGDDGKKRNSKNKNKTVAALHESMPSLLESWASGASNDTDDTAAHPAAAAAAEGNTSGISNLSGIVGGSGSSITSPSSAAPSSGIIQLPRESRVLDLSNASSAGGSAPAAVAAANKNKWKSGGGGAKLFSPGGSSSATPPQSPPAWASTGPQFSSAAAPAAKAWGKS